MKEKKTSKKEKLTKKEKKFAEENHDLIYYIMHKEHYPIDEFYDVAAIGYLKAVKNYHRRPELQKYCFSTIARHSIRQYVANEMDARRRYAGHIECSMNQFENEEKIKYSDFIYDIRDELMQWEMKEDMLAFLDDIMPYLSQKQRKHLVWLLDGYKPKEIRLKNREGYIDYNRDLKVIQDVVISVIH